MTLVVAAGNKEYVVQISDRLLSTADGPEAEENKTTLLVCRDARLLVGFTGLATFGRFRTARWLLEAVTKAATKDNSVQAVVDALIAEATRKFQTPGLRRVPPADRRLTIMLTGYAYWSDPPTIIGALITNFQDWDRGDDDAEAWDEFRPLFIEQSVTTEQSTSTGATYLQRVGAWRSLPNAEMETALRPLLERDVPASAVVGEAIKLVREAALRPEAGGTVGLALTSAVLPADPALDAYSDYHPTDASPSWLGINQVITTFDGGPIALMDPVVSTDGPPIALPKVGRNAPCPCGSRQKYKHCHGR